MPEENENQANLRVARELAENSARTAGRGNHQQEEESLISEVVKDLPRVAETVTTIAVIPDAPELVKLRKAAELKQAEIASKRASDAKSREKLQEERLALSNTPAEELTAKQIAKCQSYGTSFNLIEQSETRTDREELAFREGSLRELLAAERNITAVGPDAARKRVTEILVSVGYFDSPDQNSPGSINNGMILRHPLYRAAVAADQQAEGAQDNNRRAAQALREKIQGSVERLEARKKRLLMV